ncbi:MAG: PEP-CTERM sorting domain-containing protein [Pseudomonadota bacterium]
MYNSLAAPSVVPEPATIALLALGALGFLIRRKPV